MYGVESVFSNSLAAPAERRGCPAASTVKEKPTYHLTSYSVLSADAVLAEAYLAENNLLSVTVTVASSSSSSSVTKTLQCPSEAENRIRAVKIVRVSPRLLLTLTSSSSSKLLVLDLTSIFPRGAATDSEDEQTEEAAAAAAAPSEIRRKLNVSLFSLSTSSKGSSSLVQGSSHVTLSQTMQLVALVADLEMEGLCDVLDALDVTPPDDIDIDGSSSSSGRDCRDFRLLLVCSGGYLVVLDVLFVDGEGDQTPFISRVIVDSGSRLFRAMRRVNVVSASDTELTLAVHISCDDSSDGERVYSRALSVRSRDSLKRRLAHDRTCGAVEDRSVEAPSSSRSAGDCCDSEEDFYDMYFTDTGDDDGDNNDDSNDFNSGDGKTGGGGGGGAVVYAAIYTDGGAAVEGTNPMLKRRPPPEPSSEQFLGGQGSGGREAAHPPLRRGGSGSGSGVDEGRDTVCRKGASYYLYSMQLLGGYSPFPMGVSWVTVCSAGLRSLLSAGAAAEGELGVMIDAPETSLGRAREGRLFGVLRCGSGDECAVDVYEAEGCRWIASLTVSLLAAAGVLCRYANGATSAVTARDAVITARGDLLLLAQARGALVLLAYRRVGSEGATLCEVCEAGFASGVRVVSGETPRGVFCASADGNRLVRVDTLRKDPAAAAAAGVSGGDEALLRALFSTGARLRGCDRRTTLQLLTHRLESSGRSDLLAVVAEDSFCTSNYGTEDEVLFEFFIVLFFNAACQGLADCCDDVDSDLVGVMKKANLTRDDAYTFRSPADGEAKCNHRSFSSEDGGYSDLFSIIDSYRRGSLSSSSSAAAAERALCLLLRRGLALHGSAPDCAFRSIVVAKSVAYRHAPALMTALDCAGGLALPCALLRLYYHCRSGPPTESLLTDILRRFSQQQRINLLYEKSTVLDMITLHAHAVSRAAGSDLDGSSLRAVENTLLQFAGSCRSVDNSCYLDESSLIGKFIAATFCRLVFVLAPCEDSLEGEGDLLARARRATARLSKGFLLALAHFVAEQRIDLLAM